jgi:hypothetical protein
MSYNVDLKVNRCEHCKRSDDVEGWHWNYTSNMVPAWRSAGADLAAFDGKRRASARRFSAPPSTT